jgi:hypothetical protein
MKGAERRRALIDWLNERNALTLAEIVERFKVSKMTAHRDLALLEKRQGLKRIHGGAVAAPKEQSATPVPAGKPRQKLEDCPICHRQVGQHLLYSLTPRAGDPLCYCCAHCGVSAQLAASGPMVMALATDFLTGRPHPAQHSWFVLGSVVVPCCRPSLLTFEDEAMARRFRLGFGGEVGRLADALVYLRREMSLSQDQGGCPHCVPGGLP